jgi:hypothetical protein
MVVEVVVVVGAVEVLVVRSAAGDPSDEQAANTTAAST